MITRRQMLASGVFFVGCSCGMPSRAQQAPIQERKSVALAGQPARIIDFHAHCIVPAVEDVIRGTSLARSLPKFQIIADKRLKALDARGIDMQVLSINQYWWYAADVDLATRVVETQDAGLEAVCQAHRGRFAALSSPALQFPELAAKQLERAVKTFGLRGASIGGHVNGEVPTAPRFDPFWAKAEELGVPVFIHPNSAENVVRETAWNGRGDLGNIIGNPLETTVFLSRMIFDGTLDRFPKLRIVAAHGGGYLPSYLERTNVACHVRDDAKCANRRDPRDYFRDQIMVDSMVFTSEGLRHLVAEVGSKQIVYGSDMPFVWPDTVDTIVQLPGLADEDRIAMLSGNAASLLNL